MSIDATQWQLLELPFDSAYLDALQQQHHASQFIALVGRRLIPPQPDDSHTSMQYLPDKQILMGNEIRDGMRLALQLIRLQLQLLDGSNRALWKMDLSGHTREVVYDELRRALIAAGLEGERLQNELHFQIPDHPVAQGMPFSNTKAAYFSENTRYRHNADYVLRQISKPLQAAESVRVWPHHFDTGAILPVARDENGKVIKSIGLGWAIPDGMIDTPYFYLSGWLKDQDLEWSGVENLPVGEWMMPQWNGAVLRHGEVLKAKSASEQYRLTESFFTNGIRILTTLLT